MSKNSIICVSCFVVVVVFQDIILNVILAKWNALSWIFHIKNDKKNYNKNGMRPLNMKQHTCLIYRTKYRYYGIDDTIHDFHLLILFVFANNIVHRMEMEKGNIISSHIIRTDGAKKNWSKKKEWLKEYMFWCNAIKTSLTLRPIFGKGFSLQNGSTLWQHRFYAQNRRKAKMPKIMWKHLHKGKEKKQWRKKKLFHETWTPTKILKKVLLRYRFYIDFFYFHCRFTLFYITFFLLVFYCVLV